MNLFLQNENRLNRISIFYSFETKTKGLREPDVQGFRTDVQIKEKGTYFIDYNYQK